MTVRIEQPTTADPVPASPVKVRSRPDVIVQPIAGVVLCAAGAGAIILAVYAPPLGGLVAGVVVAAVATIWGRTRGAYSRCQGQLVAAGSAGLVAAVLAGLAGLTGFWTYSDDLEQLNVLYQSGSVNPEFLLSNPALPDPAPALTPSPDDEVVTTLESKQQTDNQESRLVPASVSASDSAPNGVDSAGRVVTFGPENTVDNDPTTAWRAPGDGIGQTVTLTWDSPVVVESVGLIPGYAKIDTDGSDRFKQNRRITSAEFLDSTNQVIAELNFDDAPSLQGLSLKTPIVTTFVKVRVLATTEPGGRDYTAISEIYVGGQS